MASKVVPDLAIGRGDEVGLDYSWFYLEQEQGDPEGKHPVCMHVTPDKKKAYIHALYAKETLASLKKFARFADKLTPQLIEEIGRARPDVSVNYEPIDLPEIYPHLAKDYSEVGTFMRATYQWSMPISVPSDAANLSLFYTYWINLIASQSKFLHHRLVLWMVGKSQIPESLQQLSDAVPTLGTIVQLKEQSFPPTYNRIQHLFLVMLLGFKSVNETHVADWARKRYSAFLASCAVTSPVNLQVGPWSRALSEYLRVQTPILEAVIDYIRKLERPPPTLAALISSIKLIAEYSGMTTIKTAVEFYDAGSSAALLLSRVYEEGAKLKKKWTELERIHGDLFPYCRVLNLPGINDLDIKFYPNVAYAAWYSRKSDKTYSQMVQPASGLVSNESEINIYASVSLKVASISWEGLSEGHKKFLEERAQITSSENLKAAVDRARGASAF